MSKPSGLVGLEFSGHLYRRPIPHARDPVVRRSTEHGAASERSLILALKAVHAFRNAL